MSNVRNLWSVLLLALAIAFGQQAALRHELEHAFQHLEAPADSQHPPGDTCEKCSAFAGFHGGLLSAALGLLLAAAAIAAFGFTLIPATARTVVATRSRAPPIAS